MDQKRKILVVDDGPVNLLQAKDMLSKLGHEIFTAENGKKCLDIVDIIHPDLIIMDVVMPVMDGIETTRVLKSNEKTRMIPIIITTTLNSIPNKVDALNAGADDFLNKPLEINELIARVNSLLKVKAYNDHLVSYQKNLENDVKRRTAQLNKSYQLIKESSEETIFRLAKVSEYRDENTGAHISRVSEYSAAVATALKLDNKTVDIIRSASPMHDIGKVGIPDYVLLKPGKFEPEEWEIMKTHTIIGSKILENSKTPLIQTAQIIALTHHEKWDGSGYPNHLKGKAIPIEGRIVAIADVFDALTTQRSYKNAFSLEKAFSIILNERGTHFDPKIAEVFLKIGDKILMIMEKHKKISTK